MRIAVGMILALALTSPARAQVQRFYLHHDDTPVPVPGGTSSFFLDESFPSSPTPFVDDTILARQETATFPTFFTAPFASDTTLLPVAVVRLHLAANQPMRSCAAVGANLFTVDAGGVQTPNGGAVRTDVDVDQAASGGTQDIGGVRVEFAVPNVAVAAGQGLALAASLENDCSLKRRTFFAFDGDEAASRIQFQCCFTAAAKCASKKMAAVLKHTDCRVRNAAKESHAGVIVDPVKNAKCAFAMSAAFAKLDYRGGCPTAADAPDLANLVAAFTSDVRAALDPLGPSRKSRCQSAKITAANLFMKCSLGLEAKAASIGLVLDPDPLKAAKCRTKFAANFAAAEAQGAAKGRCDTTGDADAIAAKVDAFVATVASRLACPCPS
jgi:hypothetical protein